MSPYPHRLAALAAGTLVVAACSFDWATLDPREAGEAGTAGTAGSGTSAGGNPSTSATGGAGGEGASSSSTSGGGTGGVGGSGPDSYATCVDFCVVFFGCEMSGDGGGGTGGSIPPDELEQMCQQDCNFILDFCPQDELPDLLACMELVETCDDVDAFQSCAAMLACAG